MREKKRPPQPTHSNFLALSYIWIIILLMLTGAGLLFWNYFS